MSAGQQLGPQTFMQLLNDGTAEGPGINLRTAFEVVKVKFPAKLEFRASIGVPRLRTSWKVERIVLSISKMRLLNSNSPAKEYPFSLRITLLVDGVPQAIDDIQFKIPSGELEEGGELLNLEPFNGIIVPGGHQLEIEFELITIVKPAEKEDLGIELLLPVLTTIVEQTYDSKNPVRLR